MFDLHGLFFRGTKVFVILNSTLRFSYNKPGHLDLDLGDQKVMFLMRFVLTEKKEYFRLVWSANLSRDSDMHIYSS